MSHPPPADGAVRCVRVPSHNSAESRWGNDYTSVTVDDVSSSLDCSGCRTPVFSIRTRGLKVAPTTLWDKSRCLQHYSSIVRLERA